MTSSPTPTAPTVKQAIRRRLPKRRDDSGLTTLEWLLIVAAVAGLAALAVVLVRNVVTQTADEISGSSARLTAATLEAADITEKALAFPISNAGDVEAMNERWGGRCTRMSLSYNAAFNTNVPKKKSMWTPGAQPAAANINQVYTDSGETPPECEIVDA